MNSQDSLKAYITKNGLPHSPEHETAVLGALLMNKAVLEMLTEAGVNNEYFHSPTRRSVYLACADLVDQGKEIDILSIKSYLKQEHADKNIIQTLLELSDTGSEILSHQVPTHIEGLIEFKQRRDLVAEGHDLVKRAYGSNGFKIRTDPFFEDLTVQSLMKMDFPDPKWIVPSIIPEGLSLLSGRPKVGKSIMSVNLAVAVASGGIMLGKIPVEQTGVLYLALEDTLKRLKQRFGTVLKDDPPPENLYLKTEFGTIKEGGLEKLKIWLSKHSDVGLVIIDTLAKIKGQTSKNAELYVDDYMAIAKIKEIADQNGIAIVLIHHTRKAESDDVFDTVLGTTGITGAADTLIVIKKERMSAGVTLHVCGRDVEETELALKFDALTMGWLLLGDAKEYRLSEERRQIIEVLKQDKEPMHLKEIAISLGKKTDNISHLLSKLANDGCVKRVGYGKYSFIQ